MPKRSRKPGILQSLLRMYGSRRPPRVTDDGDDGLAGAPVPRKPHPPVLSGAAALAVPVEEHHGET